MMSRKSRRPVPVNRVQSRYYVNNLQSAVGLVGHREVWAPSATSGKFHGQSLQSSQNEPSPPAKSTRRNSEFQGRHPSKECGNGDLAFQAGERCAKTVVHALTKCYVRIRFAPKVEPVRVLK